MIDLDVEQPFHTDLDYYEDRAAGIATSAASSVDGGAARPGACGTASRAGTSCATAWRRMRERAEPPTPFMLAFRAVEAGDRARPRGAARRASRARAGARDERQRPARDGRRRHGLELVRLLLERGADPNRGNDYGWTQLHQAGYRNRRDLAELMLARRSATLGLSARGDGGTPLVAALFWGHREVVDLLGLEPRNLRVAAGLGRVDLIGELARHARRPARTARFYRPHGGFPAWTPSDDPQEVLDEALVWAAKSDRVEAIELLVELGARSRPIRTAARRSRGPPRTGGVAADPAAARARRRRRTSAAPSAGRTTARA